MRTVGGIVILLTVVVVPVLVLGLWTLRSKDAALTTLKTIVIAELVFWSMYFYIAMFSTRWNRVREMRRDVDRELAAAVIVLETLEEDGDLADCRGARLGGH